MRPLTLAFLSAVALTQAYGQSLSIQERKCSFQHWPDFSFPVIQSATRPLAAKKMNLLLQMKELELLVGSAKVDPFEAIRDPGEDFQGNTAMSYEVKVNDGEHFSLAVLKSFNGAYPSSSSDSYLFNARTGDLVVSGDLFSEKGRQLLEQRVKAERRRILDKAIQEVKQPRSGEKADADQIELLSSVQVEGDIADFTVVRTGMAFNGSTGFPHVSQCYDVDLTVILPLSALEPYLTPYDKAFLQGGTSLPAPVWQGKLLSGTLGSKSIFMLLISPRSQAITGWYCYERFGRMIELAGTQIGQRLDLEEQNEEASTGRIQATIQGRGLAGTWTRPGGTQSQPFKVQPLP